MMSSCATTPTRRPRLSTTGAPLMFFSWNRSQRSATVMSSWTVIGFRLIRSPARSSRFDAARAGEVRAGEVRAGEARVAAACARAPRPPFRVRATPGAPSRRAIVPFRFAMPRSPRTASGTVQEALDSGGIGLDLDDPVGVRRRDARAMARMVLDRRLAELAAVRRRDENDPLVRSNPSGGARFQEPGGRRGRVRTDIDARGIDERLGVED